MRRYAAILIALLLMIFPVPVQAEGETELIAFCCMTVETDDTGALKVTDWGEDIHGQDFQSSLQMNGSFGSNQPFRGVRNAGDVWGIYSSWEENSEFSGAFRQLLYESAKGAGTDATDPTVELDPGIWLLAERMKNPGGNSIVLRLSLLEVSEKTPVADLFSGRIPQTEKRIQSETSEGWSNAVYVSAGEVLTCRLTAVVPDLRPYETYRLVFRDEIPEGTVITGEPTVTIDGRECSSFDVSEENGVLTAGCGDIRTEGAEKNSEIILIYTVKVSDGADIGLSGTRAAMTVEYSDRPNDSAAGIFNNTGMTEPCSIVLYTGALTLKSVDTDGTPLSGAVIQLKRRERDGQWMTVDVLKLSPNAKVAGVGCGTYQAVETETPAGYEPAEPAEWTISAAFDENGSLASVRSGDEEIDPQSDAVAVRLVHARIRSKGISPIIWAGGGAVLLAAALLILLLTRKKHK